MRKLLSAAGLAALAFGLSGGAAQAQDFYLEGSVGATFAGELEWNGDDYETDTGWNAAVAAGMGFGGNWEGEVELSYDRVEYSCCTPNNTREYRLMANVLYNIDAGGVTPYFGGGLGVAWVTYEASGAYEDDATVAAYQLIGGVRVPLGDNFSLFGEYRWQDTFENAEGDIDNWEHSGHNLAVGARVKLQ
jgi:opacity protein-like surface antigen